MTTRQQITAEIKVPEGFEEKVRATVQQELDDRNEWRIWVYRNDAGFDTGASVYAETEEEALEEARHAVNRVLDGVGLSFKREMGYDVVVRRLIV